MTKRKTTRQRNADRKVAVFIAEYLKDQNATRAARKAGYSAKTAKAAGCRLLTRVDVRDALAAAARVMTEKAELSAVRVLEHMRRAMEFDIRTLFDARGRILPLSELTDEQAECVAAFDVVRRNLHGDDGHSDEVVKIRLVDRLKAIEMAAKHFKLLTDVVTFQDDQITEARLREIREQRAAINKRPTREMGVIEGR